MRRLTLLGLTATLLGAAAAAAPGATAARPLYGVQGTGSTVPGRDSLTVAQRLRTNVTRIEASWAELQPDGPGATDPGALAELDRAIAAAARQRIKVVLFVNRTPCWASSAPVEVRRGCTGRTRNRLDVTRWQPVRPEDSVPISTQLVARYGNRLAAFQVWNEPDQENALYWAGPDKVRNYVRLVKAVYAPIKQANPRLPVLAGSFVGTNGAWLTAMYQEGVKGFYDGLAVQFYSAPLYALTQTRATQLRFGDRKPMWLTEFGWSTCVRRGGPAAEFGHPCVTRAAQAQNLVDLMGGLRRMPYVKAAIQFEVRDQPGSFKFGLLDAAGRPKPAYSAIARLQRGGTLRMTRPTVHLRRVGGRIVASGIASGVGLLKLRVHQGPTLRFRASLGTNRFRKWSIALPAELGTAGLRVSVRGSITGGSAQART